MPESFRQMTIICFFTMCFLIFFSFAQFHTNYDNEDSGVKRQLIDVIIIISLISMSR